MCIEGRFFVCELPVVEVYAARERARRGDADGALPLMRTAVDELFDAGQFTWFIPGTGVLAETRWSAVPPTTSLKHRPRSTDWP